MGPIPLSLLLQAAGVSLDDKSDLARDEEEADATIRSHGAVIILTITYSNTRDATFLQAAFGQLELSYEVRARHLALASYKPRVHVQTDGVAGARQLVKVHGLLFKVVQKGRAGRFSVNALLEQLGIKMGLLALLQSALDVVWLYVFPLLGFAYWADHVYEEVSTPAGDLGAKELSAVYSCACLRARKKKQGTAEDDLTPNNISTAGKVKRKKRKKK
jgi:hypothetical protein